MTYTLNSGGGTWAWVLQGDVAPRGPGPAGFRILKHGAMPTETASAQREVLSGLAVVSKRPDATQVQAKVAG